MTNNSFINRRRVECVPLCKSAFISPSANVCNYRVIERSRTLTPTRYNDHWTTIVNVLCKYCRRDLEKSRSVTFEDSFEKFCWTNNHRKQLGAVKKHRYLYREATFHCSRWICHLGAVNILGTIIITCSKNSWIFQKRTTVHRFLL